MRQNKGASSAYPHIFDARKTRMYKRTPAGFHDYRRNSERGRVLEKDKGETDAVRSFPSLALRSFIIPNRLPCDLLVRELENS